jgi:hypothetical protein
MLWNKKDPIILPNSDWISKKLRRTAIFVFPRGDFFFHFLWVGDVVFNLINDSLFLSHRNLSSW